jgi:hypothetical protein
MISTSGLLGPPKGLSRQDHSRSTNKALIDLDQAGLANHAAQFSLKGTDNETGNSFLRR